MSIKVDFKKELKQIYSPSVKEVNIIDVPDMNFLMIHGEGAPSSLQYKQAIEALFTLSYTLKFMIKKTKNIDYGVMPLESLWWTDDIREFATTVQNEWKWTSMIMQPSHVKEENVKMAIEQVSKKKEVPEDKIMFNNFHEGLSAQILYQGPYSEEKFTIAKIHNFIHKNGYQIRGKHHEIYLNDPSRTALEKLKTIIRQPIK